MAWPGQKHQTNFALNKSPTPHKPLGTFRLFGKTNYGMKASFTQVAVMTSKRFRQIKL